MKILSIVIPTKNRYEYLKYAIEIILEYKESDLELVIHDNSLIQSQDFLEYIRSLNDEKIVYLHCEQRLSVVENCERAIDAASGEYVCMIGDDDAVLPSLCMDITKYAKSHRIDGVVINKASYYWPDTGHAVWGDRLSSRIFVQEYTYGVKSISAMSELDKVLSNGATSSMMDMPRVYHGIVSKSTLKKLKDLAGTYFPGPSPDMANAVGLCAVSNNVVYFDAPAVISGHGKKSTGGMGGEKKHHGKIEDQEHLPKGTAQKWSAHVPKFWSGPTIYCESAEKALAGTGLIVNRRINYSYMYAYCLIFESKYYREIFKAMAYNINAHEMVKIIKYFLSILIFRLKNLMLNFIKFNQKESMVCRVDNTFEAYVRVKEGIAKFDPTSYKPRPPLE